MTHVVQYKDLLINQSIGFNPQLSNEVVKEGMTLSQIRRTW